VVAAPPAVAKPAVPKPVVGAVAAPPPTGPPPTPTGISMAGQRIRVWWPDEKVWFGGEVRVSGLVCCQRHTTAGGCAM
jgi:hypothetical protein